jgi:hypothetical protein
MQMRAINACVIHSMHPTFTINQFDDSTTFIENIWIFIVKSSCEDGILKIKRFTI